MPMLQILVTAVGLTLGSLLVAISLSCLAWWLATRVHHPRWGAAFLLIIVGGTWLAALGQSEFVKMATVFALVGAGLLYLVGPVGPKLRFWPSRRTFWERGIRY
ncbi:hypothetical protein [Sphingobium sp. CAP-1]|uniref:hypothetical protein n=1 Tax=Sphingobium sp. CAP-1 TaxID=2676077 RepID=UPI001E5BEBDA|nr:hypothetical protein [Sphingobium sp. CAP-1]